MKAAGDVVEEIDAAGGDCGGGEGGEVFAPAGGGNVADDREGEPTGGGVDGAESHDTVVDMSTIKALAPRLMTTSSSSRICPALDTSICSGSTTIACFPVHRTGNGSSANTSPPSGHPGHDERQAAAGVWSSLLPTPPNTGCAGLGENPLP